MSLKWTGERLVTNVDSLFGTFEHLHRYALSLDICRGRIVLDIASGEGYGTNLIADVAQFVYGVDISEEAIEHSKKKYQRKNIQFKCGSAVSIPLDDNAVEVVVSFETLEHLQEQDDFLKEIKRVLKEDGMLVLSTPNKTIYFERDSNNPFHIKEVTTEEFISLIKNHFNYFLLFQQRIFIGSVVSQVGKTEGNYRFFDGNFSGIQTDLQEQDFFNKPYFNLIVATNSSEKKIASPTISLFSAYKVYETEKQILEEKLIQSQQLKLILSSRSYKFSSLIARTFINPVRFFFRKMNRQR